MRKIFAGLCLSVACSFSLAASTIQYTESGQLSGTLGATHLTNVNFVFTFLSNTANVTGNGSTSNPFQNVATSNTISIGSSNGSFTSAVEVGDIGPYDLIGFSNTALTAFIAFQNAAAGSYNLGSAIGPLTSSTAYYDGGSLSTSLGTLTITGAQNLSFKATTTATPEPSMVGLIGFGLLGMIVAGRRSWKRTASAC
jgi:hypothetical protein